MGLVNKNDDLKKYYHIITNQAEKKIISQSKLMNIDKFVFDGKNKHNVIYYDTADSLLFKTGLILYKTIEKGEYYFRIERQDSLPSISKFRKNEVFELKILPKDTPQTQSFFLINGIDSMFATRFSIDLENIIKNVRPLAVVEFNVTKYKGFKGNGFKCNIEFEKVIYRSPRTKRKKVNNELAVFMTSSKNFEQDFYDFIISLEKYCKDIIPKTENLFNYALAVTKDIDHSAEKEKRKLEKEMKKAKSKEIKAEDRIED